MTEFELIYRYFKLEEDKVSSSNFSTASIIKGIGDDAAVIDFTSPSQMVTCVDTVVQGRHFSEDWHQVYELAFAIGYKAIAVNISDVSAMGAKPHSVLLALALPERLANEAWLSQFAKGLSHACRQFGVHLIGGDTTRNDKLVISVTANGIMQKNTRPIYRNGAKVGDKVYVSGTLGDACYALHHPENEIGKKLAHRLHMPTPRMYLSQLLTEMGQVNAMIDISDGLAQDLNHMCQQSKVAIRLNLENLPSSEPLEQVQLSERLLCQLTGGDDYELAFTLPAEVTIPQSDARTRVTCIGEVINTEAVIKTDGNDTNIELCYQNNRLTKENPYPFQFYHKLKGFQHFG